MNKRETGVLDVLIIFVGMALGAAFVFGVFQVANATRPPEVLVWSESTPTSNSASSSTSSPPSATVTPVPSPASAAPASNDSLVASGKAVFEKNCNGCHPGGNAGVGKALNAPDFKQRYPQDSDIAKVIQEGKGGIMPSFKGRLSDDEITAVIAYIRTLS